MKTTIVFSCFIVSLLMLGCSSDNANTKLGSESNPVKLFFTPSIESETIVEGSKEMIKFLETETGLFFKTSIPTNYITVVEAFGSEKSDVAIMNSFGYLLANEKYQATAELKVLRGGEASYRGQILAHVNSGINKIEDITGKRFAFTDPSSTSGYLYPLKLFRNNGVVPQNTVFGMKHDNVIAMIYQGQVDAGATYYSAPDSNGKIKDARIRVLTQYPDVEEKIKIIALTDEIPNDPVVFRAKLDEEVKLKVKNGLLKYIQTKQGSEIFKNMYGIDGIVSANDNDYDMLRKMIKEINVNIEETLK